MTAPAQRPDPTAPQADSTADTEPAAPASLTAAGRGHLGVSGLSYEAARDELVAIVARLEGGKVALEESMQLWERGEALADHCAAWLDGAERRLRHEDGPGTDAHPAAAGGEGQDRADDADGAAELGDDPDAAGGTAV